MMMIIMVCCEVSVVLVYGQYLDVCIIDLSSETNLNPFHLVYKDPII